MRGLVEWYIHFRVAAGFRTGHYRSNLVKVTPHNAPCRIAQHDNRYLSARQILLIVDSFIGRE